MVFASLVVHSSFQHELVPLTLLAALTEDMDGGGAGEKKLPEG